jgi:hypothetical protein
LSPWKVSLLLGYAQTKTTGANFAAHCGTSCITQLELTRHLHASHRRLPLTRRIVGFVDFNSEQAAAQARDRLQDSQFSPSDPGISEHLLVA